MSYAITPLVAATTPDDRPKILGFLQNGLFVNIGLALLLVILGLFASNFLHLFGQEEAVAQAAKPYVIIICSSIFPILVFQTFRQFLEGQSDTLSPMIVSIAANLLNVGLNYVMIYGKFGFPAMGLVGAGYATLISRIVMALLIIWFSRKKTSGFKWQFDLEVSKRLLKIGIPSGMQYVFEVGAFATAAIMVGWISAEALAAHNIALNLAAVTYMASTGVAAASTIRIGNQMGKKDKKNLRVAGFSAFGMVVVFMAFCGILFILLRNILPGWYIDNEEVKSIASTLLVFAAAFQISDGSQAVGLGVLRGLTDVKIPTLATFIAFWLISIPLGYFLGFTAGWGVNGIWSAICAGLTVASVFHLWRFNYLTKRLEF
ncbi:MAG: MATE family efflux transporter [Bacteroidota bacterium]